MKTAAILSFAMALVLLGMAIAGMKADSDSYSYRMSSLYAALDRGTIGDLDRLGAEHDAVTKTINLEGIGGVIFLIAGFALWSKRTKVRTR